MSNSLKNGLKALPLNKKIILGSGALLIVSMFMPWYSDIDQFNTGDSFLGITGPLYLAGLFILVAGVMSFGLIMMEVLGKPEPQLPVENKYFHVTMSSFSILMLVLMLSVYFHPKFGINLVNKNAGFGMILGFMGMIGIILGALMKEKVRKTHMDLENHLEDRQNAGVVRRDEGYTGPVDRSERIPTIEELTAQINSVDIHE